MLTECKSSSHTWFGQFGIKKVARVDNAKVWNHSAKYV